MLGALIAWSCVNGMVPPPDSGIEDVKEAERLVEAGKYDDARGVLDRVYYGANLEERIRDLHAVIALRAPLKKEITAWVLPHFRDRMKHLKDVRYQAWLAEAQLLHGSQTVALALITDLKKRDLMPDAYAYLTLAKLSIGEQREAALAACRTRAKAKSICKV